jgi:hypothetical protein
LGAAVIILQHVLGLAHNTTGYQDMQVVMNTTAFSLPTCHAVSAASGTAAADWKLMPGGMVSSVFSAAAMYSA